MKCPNCGGETPQENRLCSYCGSELPQPQKIENTNVVQNITYNVSYNGSSTPINYKGSKPTVSPKSKIIALCLAILLGYFGAHQFYAGKTNMGWLYLFTVGLFGIGWIVDIVRICTGTFKDINGLPLK